MHDIVSVKMAEEGIYADRMEIGGLEGVGMDVDNTDVAYRTAKDQGDSRKAPTSNAKSVLEYLTEYFSNSAGCGIKGFFAGTEDQNNVQELKYEVLQDSDESPEVGSLYQWKDDLPNIPFRDLSLHRRVVFFLELIRYLELGMRFDHDAVYKCYRVAQNEPVEGAMDKVMQKPNYLSLRQTRTLETRDVADVVNESLGDEALLEDNPNRKTVYSIILKGRVILTLCRPKGEVIEYHVFDMQSNRGRGAAMMSFGEAEKMSEYCEKLFEEEAKEDKKLKYKSYIFASSIAYKSDKKIMKDYESAPSLPKITPR